MASRFAGLFILAVLWFSVGTAQNFYQEYSARAGYFSPHKGLNNGFIFGADGSFILPDYRIVLRFSGDCYIKQTVDLFEEPKPQIVRQQVLLVPIGVSVSYQVVEPVGTGLKVTVGLEGGYYVDFYSVDYRDVLRLTPLPVYGKDSQSGGNFFYGIVARIGVANFFLEPKILLARPHREDVGSYRYGIDPSGFMITVGFQY